MGYERALLFRLATSERLEQVIKGVPAGERLAWRAASRYVAGGSREDGLAIANGLLDQGHGISVDLFGERVDEPAVAERVLGEYLELAAALPRPPADAWLSVDLSHLGLSVDTVGAADRLAQIAAALPAGRRLQVGAEEAATVDAGLRCLLVVAARGLADRLGATIQANLKRSPADVLPLTDAGIHVRTCQRCLRGAGRGRPSLR